MTSASFIAISSPKSLSQKIGEKFALSQTQKVFIPVRFLRKVPQDFWQTHDKLLLRALAMNSGKGERGSAGETNRALSCRPTNIVERQNRWKGRTTGVRLIRCRYFVTIAPTSDWKILKPSVPPSSGSAARSGCGIMPSTLRPSLQIPAIFSREPLGFASRVISPDEVA